MSKKKILSKFTDLGWTAFIAILGHRLDILGKIGQHVQLFSVLWPVY